MKKVITAIFSLALVFGCTNVEKPAETVKKYPAFDVQNMDTTIKAR